MTTFRITEEMHKKMLEPRKHPLGFYPLVGKVVEFSISANEGWRAMCKNGPVNKFTGVTHERLIGIVRVTDSQLLLAAIDTGDVMFVEGEVDTNSIRICSKEEAIIWKLTNE